MMFKGSNTLMTVHIEQLTTGMFYGTTGTFTLDRANALEFGIVAVARELCRSLNLRDIQIVEEDSAGARVIHDVKNHALD